MATVYGRSKRHAFFLCVVDTLRNHGKFGGVSSRTHEKKKKNDQDRTDDVLSISEIGSQVFHFREDGKKFFFSL